MRNSLDIYESLFIEMLNIYNLFKRPVILMCKKPVSLMLETCESYVKDL